MPEADGQWEKRLRLRWFDLQRRAGVEPPLEPSLLQGYADKNRHYHNLEHLEEVLAWAELAPLVEEDRQVLQWALFYHDAIYQTRRSDNEALSARLAESQLSGLGVARVGDIRKLILDTRHQAIPSTPLGQYMADIDLAILGADWERFKRYDSDIRREYAWVPWFLYRSRRRTLLKQFLERQPLYLSDWMRQLREQPARANLARLLEEL